MIMIKSYKPYKVKRKFFFYKNLKDNDGRLYTVWFNWCLVIYRADISYFLGRPIYRGDEVFIPSQVKRIESIFCLNHSDDISALMYFNNTNGLPALSYGQYQALKEYFDGKK